MIIPSLGSSGVRFRQRLTLQKKKISVNKSWILQRNNRISNKKKNPQNNTFFTQHNNNKNNNILWIFFPAALASLYLIAASFFACWHAFILLRKSSLHLEGAMCSTRTWMRFLKMRLPTFLFTSTPMARFDTFHTLISKKKEIK